MWARLRKGDCRRAFAIGSETKKTCGRIGFEGEVVCLSHARCSERSFESLNGQILGDREGGGVSGHWLGGTEL